MVIEIAIREWQWLKVNPLTLVKKPPDSKPRRRGVTQQEIDKICLALVYTPDTKVTMKKQEVAVMFLLAIETAMRLSELISLTRENVDLNRRVATLIDTKNGDRREVPLSRVAVDLIKKLLGGGQNIFTINKTVSATFRKAKLKAGLADLHFHDSRSEGITRLSKKLDVLTLARVIGHKDLKSLLIYYHADAEEIAKLL